MAFDTEAVRYWEDSEADRAWSVLLNHVEMSPGHCSCGQPPIGGRDFEGHQVDMLVRSGVLSADKPG